MPRQSAQIINSFGGVYQRQQCRLRCKSPFDKCRTVGVKFKHVRFAQRHKLTGKFPDNSPIVTSGGGGFILGFAEVALRAGLPSAVTGLADGVLFAVVVIIIISRPEGILGVKQRLRT